MISGILWSKIYLLMGDHLATNHEEVVMLRKHLTDVTHQLYVDIIGSAEYQKELRTLFQGQELSEAMVSIGSAMCLDVFVFFVNHVAANFTHQLDTETVNLSVSDMPSEGLAKLSHVEGWAIRKELERNRRFIRQNVYSQSAVTRQSVTIAHAKCNLVEENLIVQYFRLKDHNNFPGSLDVTEDRQYRERGLPHISDEPFVCFQRIEEIRVETMNSDRFMRGNGNFFVDRTIQMIRSRTISF